MKTLKCKCGKDILVDDEDFNKVSGTKWSCSVLGRVRSIMDSTQGLIGTSLVDLVLDVKPGEERDHIDRNSHNNQRSNLRACSRSDNNCNKGIQKNNSTGYKGVYMNSNYNGTGRTNNKKFRMQIRKDGKTYSAYYSTAEEAARAYDRKAIELHGQFAFLNFPLK